MAKKIITFCIVLLMATIVSCKKENNTTTPSSPEKVHLAKEYSIVGNDTITTTYYWENNILHKIITEEVPEWDTCILVTTTTFNYENGLLKESIIKLTYEGVSVSATSSFSYEDGQISKFIYYYSVYDTILVVDNFDFDADGNITKMLNHYYEYGSFETLLTWENDDIVAVNENGNIDNYTYDDKPSVYTGFPIWKIDNSVSFSLYASKHNKIDTLNYEYTYDGDKLVSKKKIGDDCMETHYIYTDGTGR
jgi:hypothetical protein